MTDPQLRKLKLTFTWMETNPLLLETDGAGAPFAFLGRDYHYEPYFEKVGKLGKSDAGLMHPWPTPEGQRFWTYYLEETPGLVKPNGAWRALVPLRIAPPISVSAPFLGSPARVEGFFYPHAFASMMTFDVRAPGQSTLTLDECVTIAQKIFSEEKLTLQVGGATEKLYLKQVKDRLREQLRTMCFGNGAAPGKVTGSPFSVATFLSTKDAVIKEPVADGGDIHRALQALVDWSPTWKDDELSPLADRVMPRRKAAPKSDVVFAGPRGRAVWMPKYAGDPPPKRPKLSCYHRNQALAAMQVDALGALITTADARLAQWDDAGAALQECTRYAAGLLARLYLRTTSTYQSASCRRQIEDAKLLDALGRVREQIKMPAIAMA